MIGTVPTMAGEDFSQTQARALGIALKELREHAGLTLRALADRVGISHATLGRNETADRLPGVAEVRRILDALGVSGPRAAEILERAEQAKQANWLEINDHLDPRNVSWQLRTLVDEESAAESIISVANYLMPGLLQTPDYAKAVYLGCRDVPAGQIDALVTIRMKRQDVLKHVKYQAYIDESVLTRLVGSHEIASRQLRHILAMSRRPNVDVRILPSSLGVHPAATGSYLLIQPANQPPIVHIEHPTGGGVFLDQRRGVEAYLRRTDTLQQLAASPAMSAELVRSAIAVLESKGT